MTLAVRLFRLALEAVTIGLLLLLSVIVVLAVIFRYSGSSLIWYDEVASVLLAWITYYGAALAALNRRHLSFSGFLLSLGAGVRKLLFAAAEAVVYAVFITMAWASWFVLGVMSGESLISLDWVPLQFTQSVVPIGCVLFVLGQVLSTPLAWSRIVAGRAEDLDEIEAEIARQAPNSEVKQKQSDLGDGQ
ncbi:TRAP transporter small permease [Pelagibius sp. Alg239-R121]|uniref:TRAP transporter small permease n=1 Tax=Pelagibius sp. Alg239-R121 TaxID=2993448 RepID=UPI0024A6E3C1|nr:TRAP transporter small permease subunit [Pelagibius sp. Alg239-R121]